MLNSCVGPKISLSRTPINTMRLLWGIVGSQMYKLFVDANAGHPAAVALHGNALKHVERIFPFTSVCSSLCIVSRSQKFPAIICSISKLVVDFVLGPFAGHVQPSKSMRQIRDLVYFDSYIAVFFMDKFCKYACSVKQSRFWVVCQNRAHILRGQIITWFAGFSHSVLARPWLELGVSVCSAYPTRSYRGA